MRPIFTIHAGEFLFGEMLMKKVPTAELWLPVKDKGIDFLVTRKSLRNPISVQVKMTRDYSPTLAKTKYHQGIEATGWVTIKTERLMKSGAEIWSFIIVSRDRKTRPEFINIPSKILLKNLENTFGKQSS